MSSTYIEVDLRNLVISRANRLCEYCLIHEDDTYWGCQIDHIISEKHDGATHADNLANACTFCNRHKGSDVGSVILPTNEFVRFFNPRTDSWLDHFELESIEIKPLTNIGKVTARILGFNSFERLLERQALQMIGRYPSPEALILIESL
ncbi:hypothetical protein MNBD_CHLOROFLEXI01-4554 [hydrothermal vent metagenome]|uniref:HNH nuclease domain-containing protein n=1 Tax=hydrothermal vent metagenome TaxID=652676 RepID=A0A3B0VH25_9ZZZZ